MPHGWSRPRAMTSTLTVSSSVRTSRADWPAVFPCARVSGWVTGGHDDRDDKQGNDPFHRTIHINATNTLANPVGVPLAANGRGLPRPADATDGTTPGSMPYLASTASRCVVAHPLFRPFGNA